MAIQLHRAAVLSKAVALLSICGLAMTGVANDEGMWLLEKPPTAQMKAKYGFEPSAAWMEHAQKSAVRFMTGGSGSVVSPDGLVLTNHHVGADMLAKLSTKERDLLVTGFLAGKRDEELKCPDLELNILWTIADVTVNVNAGVTDTTPAADAAGIRRKTISAIEAESEKATGLKSEVVTLYRGGKYHLYCYKRFTDVRLVFAPEQEAAFFGGDTDNFEFPRFNLDMCLFRIYENDKPLKSEHYLKWSEGSKENDLAIVIGHPGTTRRLYSVDHLKFLRDVETPMQLQGMWRTEVKLQNFGGRSAENARIAKDDVSGVANGRKFITGQLAGLQDPVLFGRKIAAEKALRDAVNAKPEYKAKWGDAWDKLAAAQRARREWNTRYQAVARGIRSDLFTDARRIVQLGDELTKPSGERLKEYRDSALESLYLGLYSPAPVYDKLEVFKLDSGLAAMGEMLGADDPVVVTALAGKSPAQRAAELVAGTTLKDIVARKKLVEGGKAAVDASKDPMILLAKSIDYEYRELRKRYEDQVEAVERESYAKIAAAKFAIEGESTYPDATFTLRMSYGPIKGYSTKVSGAGETVPAYTTLGGMFERYEERKGQEGFSLPERWLKGKEKLDLKTPFNFVCSADIIGGNSGSPVVNAKGELIGLIFDGNLHSLASAVAFDSELARAVAVDSRAIVEAMTKLYGADGLVKEITGR